jgi:hypothetical protein
MDELELEHAVEALDRGGPAAVSAYMYRLDTLFAARHHLLTAAGVDVVSGRDLSNLLPQYPAATKGWRKNNCYRVVVSIS